MMWSHPPCRNMWVMSGTNVARVQAPVERSCVNRDQSKA
jgi:hypothetical protein